MAVTQRLQDATGIIASDELGDSLFLVGEGVPTDGAGFAKGCIYVRSDGTDKDTTLYVNLGTASSSTFTSLEIV
jgi:hypothetical protein